MECKVTENGKTPVKLMYFRIVFKYSTGVNVLSYIPVQSKNPLWLEGDISSQSWK